jgi:hypothetical protein
MINISFQLSVYCVLCYFHESGVGVEFIRTKTGLINQTPTLIQGQVGLSSWKRGSIFFLFSGTFGHDASCPYIELLASGSFYSRDTRYAIPDTILFRLLTTILFTRYDSRDTRYEFSQSIFSTLIGT